MGKRYPYKPAPLAEANAEYIKTELDRIAEAIAVPDLYQCLAAPLYSAKQGGGGVGSSTPQFSPFRGNIDLYTFDDSVEQEMWLAMMLPHDYKESTDINLNMHWSPGNNTDTGTVRWGFEYMAAKSCGQEVFPAATTIYAEQAGSGTAYMHQTIEASSAITDSFEPGTVVLLRIYRDATHANDTFVGDAFGVQVSLVYQRDKDGTQNKNPPFSN